MGFPHSSVGKESACNAGGPSLIPGLGRSPGEGIGYPLQYSWASLVAQPLKNPPVMWETWVDPWVGKIPWRRERLPTSVFWPGEFHELYSPKSIDCIDCIDSKSQTRLSDFHFHSHSIYELMLCTLSFKACYPWQSSNRHLPEPLQ